MKKIYLDSCIIIYSHEATREVKEKILLELFPKKAEMPGICTSDLARFECRVKPIRERNNKLLHGYEKFFLLPEVAIIQLSRSVFDLAADLRARKNLKTPDAVHLAAAIHAGCDEFWTNDLRLEKASKGKITIRMYP